MEGRESKGREQREKNLFAAVCRRGDAIRGENSQGKSLAQALVGEGVAVERIAKERLL